MFTHRFASFPDFLGLVRLHNGSARSRGNRSLVVREPRITWYRRRKGGRGLGEDPAVGAAGERRTGSAQGLETRKAAGDTNHRPPLPAERSGTGGRPRMPAGLK